ncbi:PilN domain-containing protein [Bacillus massiliigorillae]|uniref:PilN domain-containing protein n=1 Tax=Bacillus massiliigorillae TaxID=1243664 RepID=UPI0003A1F60F|nr:hypothetical protein [Bacillus massiliigorillae]
MLVEINLLPKKEPRNYKLISISAVVIILILALSVFFYFTYDSYKKESAQLDEQIMTTKQIAGIVQSQNDAATRNDSAQQLKSYIEWSELDRVKTVPLLVHIIGLLPERGYFMNFNYVTEGTIQLSVQFDTSKEAADYLNSLSASSWITEAKLTSLATTTNPYEEEEKNKEKVDTQEQNKALTTVEGNSDAYIPRYLGIYELTINKAKALQIAKEAQTSSKKEAE